MVSAVVKFAWLSSLFFVFLSSRIVVVVAMTSSSSSSSATTNTQAFHPWTAAAVELSNAQFVNSVLTVERSVRDWDQECRLTYLYHLLPWATTVPPPSLLDKSIAARLVSPSGKTTVIVQTMDNNDKKKKKTALQIWQGPHMIRRIPASLLEGLHGNIIVNDVTFGSPSFSNEDKYLVYAAERLPVSTCSYWSSNPKQNDVVGGQYVLGQGIEEDWGERYENQAPLLDLFVLDLDTGKVARLSVDILENQESRLNAVSLGQAVFSGNNHKIAFTAFDAGTSQSRRLGMIYCRNRPSRIYEADLTNLLAAMDQDDNELPTSIPCTCISSDFRLARSPRYISLLSGGISDSALVFLGHQEGFHSHDGCMGLYVSLAQKAQEIIPPINTPWSNGPKIHGLGFPGIFTGDLPVDCNVGETNSILLSTIWGSVTRIVQVNVVTGNWNVLEFEHSSRHATASHAILCKAVDDTDELELFISETACNLPTRIWKLSWNKLDLETSTPTIVQARTVMPLADLGSIACTGFSSVTPQVQPAFEMEIVTLPTADDSDDDPVQALVLLPKIVPDADSNDKNKVPLVVLPHGGPHSCSTSSFVPGFAFLASRYAVVLPNYRGSLGFGQRPLSSLLGNIGRNDVDDVMACTKYVLNKYADRIDNKRIAICGGSHGGFLAAHCTGQYPDYFKAAVIRNPVTNIASMVTVTDIPDWCYAECLGTTLNHGAIFRGPTREEVDIMYQKSPIGLMEKVQAPTLVALGLQDLRVPPSQGKEWYYALRSRVVPVELLVYPKDNHALSLVATEADHWIRIMQWLEKYLE